MLTKSQIDQMSMNEIITHVNGNEDYAPSVLKRMNNNVATRGTGKSGTDAVRSEMVKAEVSRYRRETDCNIAEAESMVLYGEIRTF